MPGITEKLLTDELNQSIVTRYKEICGILENKSQNATLVLGAGINASVGLPTWDGLLARLITIRSSTPPRGNPQPLTLPTKDEYYRSKNVFPDVDVLEVAEYIRGITPPKSNPRADMEELQFIVREALKPNKENYTQAFLSERALGCVTELAARHFQASHGDKQHRNRSVITFNYDDLLEHYAVDFLRIKVQAVYDGKKIDRTANLHVYHPHGFLPLVNSAGESSKNIVLTEDSYYDLERYAYSWENFVVVRALQDSTCIFCGFSGNDFNFKRIIRNLPPPTSNESWHYLLVTINSIVDELSTKKSKLSKIQSLSEVDDLKVSKERLEACLRMKEEYWKRKGFLPVWTTYHQKPEMDDLHVLLKSLAES